MNDPRSRRRSARTAATTRTATATAMTRPSAAHWPTPSAAPPRRAGGPAHPTATPRGVMVGAPRAAAAALALVGAAAIERAAAAAALAPVEQLLRVLRLDAAAAHT